MNLGAVIDVAIGMVFMWIALSLATIQIQEWIMTRLNKRARDMETTIREMLANPNLKAQFYDHPVIKGLSAKKGVKASREKRKLPSYIPAENFALVIFDIAMTAGTESSLIQQGILKIRDDLEKTKSKPRDQAVIDALNTIADLARSAAATDAGTSITNYTKDVLTKEVNRLSNRYLESKDEELKRVGQALKKALLEAKIIAESELKKIKQAAEDGGSSEKKPGKKEVDPVLTQLRHGIAAISVVSPELNETLSTLLFNVEEYTTEKEKQLAKARENVEKWFDSSMDRLSGVFKRYTQAMALILGIVFSSLLNVDSLSVAQYLWHEPSVRQVLVERAVAYQPTEDQSEMNPQQTAQQFSEQFASLGLPIGWVVENTGGTAFYDNDCQLFPNPGQFFGIPVFSSNICITTNSRATNQPNIAFKILGILITAGATAQGAPFWFDMLKKLVNLRGTGPNPVEKGAGK